MSMDGMTDKWKCFCFVNTHEESSGVQCSLYISSALKISGDRGLILTLTRV